MGGPADSHDATEWIRIDAGIGLIMPKLFPIGLDPEKTKSSGRRADTLRAGHGAQNHFGEKMLAFFHQR